VDTDEFDAFKRESTRMSAMVWWLVIFGSAAIGYGVTLASIDLAGLSAFLN
jgi:hypothetical protein